MSLPPVLLVHGFGSSFEHGWVRTGWTGLLADQGRSVVRVDLLGHGRAAKPHDPQAYSVLDDEIVRTVGTMTVDAVGFSAGAAALLRLLGRSDITVRRAVLLGLGDRHLDNIDDDGDFARALNPGTGWSGDQQVRVFQRLVRDPRNDWQALAAFVSGHPSQSWEDLAPIRTPTLLAIGDQDPAGPVDRLASILPEAQTLVVPGLDHFATPSDPTVVEAALTFLSAG